MTVADYPAYLFDLDGTLVDTAPDLQRALNHALAQTGVAAVGEDLTRHWVGHGVRAMLDAALSHRQVVVDEQQLDELTAACLTHYGAHLADFSRPYPSVVETLGLLSERAALAVVTNKPADLSVKLLAALDMSKFFGVVVGRGTTAKPKPDAEPARYACERLGKAPQQALFVGDSETDVLCARATGCDVALVSYGYSHGIAPETLGADHVIDSFRQLV